VSRPTAVRPGQVWACTARYDVGRTFKVVNVEFGAGRGADVAVCEILSNSNQAQALIDDPRTSADLRPSDRRGHPTRIRVDRLLASAGYRLIGGVREPEAGRPATLHGWSSIPAAGEVGLALQIDGEWRLLHLLPDKARALAAAITSMASAAEAAR
jgi:hypothetical protein